MQQVKAVIARAKVEPVELVTINVPNPGPDVTDVAPGDFVVLTWRAVCGECRACKRGDQQYCFATHNAKQKMTLGDGTELSPALGIGAFAEETLVAAGQCTKVDAKARPAAVGLLGGPGATGRSYSDLRTLERSIRAKLFALPADTTVHTGHGNSTTIGKERAQMAAEEVRRRVRTLPREECVR